MSFSNPSIFPRTSINRGFDPSSISGLIGWWDADDPTTITEVADAVSQLDDKSGEGNHVTQGTGTEQPLTNTNTIGGKNTITFDGVNDNLKRTTFTGGAISQPNTIFIVANLKDVETTGTNYMVDGGSSSRHTFNTPNGADRLNQYAGSHNTALSGQTNGSALYTLIYDTTSSELRKNSSVQVSGDAGTRDMNGVTLGATYVNSAHAEFDLGEILIYDGLVSETDITAIEGYLNPKWGSDTW